MKATNGPDHQRDRLTVVIASLGGDSLKSTIEALNRGSVVPNEILVCIPKTEAHRLSNFSFNNLKVVTTECRGQVAQRALGFRSASHALVMQLDDDMTVSEHCVEHLLNTLRSEGPKIAVGPSLIARSTGKSYYGRSQNSALLERVYFRLLNGSAGFRPGTVSKSGQNIGWDPIDAGQEPFEVEWLAGGCVMHHRDNLIMENFYPFEGKAYCEDLIHTHILRMRGIRLLVAPRALCRLEAIPYTTLSLRDFAKDLVSEYRARKYLVKISSRSIVRMHFFYLARVLIYVIKKCHQFKHL